MLMGWITCLWFLNETWITYSGWYDSISGQWLIVACFYFLWCRFFIMSGMIFCLSLRQSLISNYVREMQEQRPPWSKNVFISHFILWTKIWPQDKGRIVFPVCWKTKRLGRIKSRLISFLKSILWKQASHGEWLKRDECRFSSISAWCGKPHLGQTHCSADSVAESLTLDLMIIVLSFWNTTQVSKIIEKVYLNCCD